MNRSKTYIGIAAAFGALAALAHFTAKPLLAEVKAALIENVDEPARNPFSEDFAIGPAASGCDPLSCFLQGNVAVPAGKRLVITNITGRAYVFDQFNIGSGAYAELLTVDANGGAVADEWLPDTVVFMGGFIYSINFNLQLQSYVEAGQKIDLRLAAGIGTINGGPGGIRVSGYYVNL
jgi:hypothetical protein